MGMKVRWRRGGFGDERRVVVVVVVLVLMVVLALRGDDVVISLQYEIYRP